MQRVDAMGRMGEVADHVGAAFEEAGRRSTPAPCSPKRAGERSIPYVGSFTFGEQGPGPGANTIEGVGDAESENIHGNLMFNIVFFGKRGRDPSVKSAKRHPGARSANASGLSKLSPKLGIRTAATSSGQNLFLKLTSEKAEKAKLTSEKKQL